MRKITIKRLLLVCCVFTIISSMFSCSSNQAEIPKERYSMNGSVSMGAVEGGGLDKTKVAYSVAISGSKQDIENIDAQEPLVSAEYYDLMLINGPHNAEIKGKETENPYLEISGSFVFDTDGKSKEQIDAMNLFQGIKIVDKDKEEYILNFIHNPTK